MIGEFEPSNGPTQDLHIEGLYFNTLKGGPPGIDTINTTVQTLQREGNHSNGSTLIDLGMLNGGIVFHHPDGYYPRYKIIVDGTDEGVELSRVVDNGEKAEIKKVPELTGVIKPGDVLFFKKRDEGQITVKLLPANSSNPQIDTPQVEEEIEEPEFATPDY